ALEINLPCERMTGRTLPLAPNPKVLQEKPRAGVTLFLETHVGKAEEVAGRAIEEVLVDGDHDVPTARQELTQVIVSSIRKILRAMVAMNDEDERKRPVTLRVKDAALEGKLGRVESPVACSRPALNPA